MTKEQIIEELDNIYPKFIQGKKFSEYLEKFNLLDGYIEKRISVANINNLDIESIPFSVAELPNPSDSDVEIYIEPNVYKRLKETIRENNEFRRSFLFNRKKINFRK